MTINDIKTEWATLNDLVTLRHVEPDFSATVHSPLHQLYIQTIAQYCPKNGTTCEVESTDAYTAIWLSKQKYRASAVIGSGRLAERARYVIGFMQSRARVIDPEALDDAETCYDVLHHLDVLQKLQPGQIRSLLAKQVQIASAVVFCVPYCVGLGATDSADPGLMTVDEWTALLQEFRPKLVKFLKIGSSGFNQRLLCVLPGAKASPPSSPRVVRQSSAIAESGGYATQIRVRWEGSFWMHGSLAHVNREICQRLCRDSAVELSIQETDETDYDPTLDPHLAKLTDRLFHPLSGKADIHVRQGYSFRTARVQEGRFAVMQPWDFVYLPQMWIDPIMRNVDEVWCNSEFVRMGYLKSGIPEDRLAMVPLGIDPEIFHPGAPVPNIPDIDKIVTQLKDKFVFLYVGATVERKGFDTLLAAYTKEFTNRDDAVLLIKDHGIKTIYSGTNSSKAVRGVMSDSRMPKIVYLDEEVPADMLAGVMCMAHCSVHPYRAEGFCLPALEAMACGVPVIATLGGPTDDYIDDTVGWRVPATTYPIAASIVGYTSFVGPTQMFKVDVDELARTMRSIYNNPTDALNRGRRAAERAASGWTWQHTSDIIVDRMRILRDSPPRVRGMASQWISHT